MRAEDAEVVGLGDGSGDVIPAATFVFGHGNFHAGIFGVNFGLKAAENVDGRVAEFLIDPRVAVASVGVGGIPEITRALHDELHLRIGERRAGQVDDACAVDVVVFGVPVEVIDVDQRFAVRGRSRVDGLQIFVRKPVRAAGRGA